MDTQECVAFSVIFIVIGLIAIIAVPGCMQKQRESILKCLELRPNASMADCQKAIPQ